MMKKTDGFTIIELIIVMAVMAILAGLGYNYYGNQREKSSASIMYTDLQTIELALDNFARADGISQWWPQSEFGSTGKTDNPTISEIQATTDLKRYLATVPDTPVETQSGYTYDNDFEYSSPDGYNPNSCGSSDVDDGINIAITASSTHTDAKKVFDLLDDTEDDGDPSCGRITQIGSSGSRTLFYHIAIDKDDYPSSLE